MSKIKGTVARVGEGKFSKFVVLKERDGFFFNTKFEPQCGEGDVVGIEYEQKGDKRGNIQKLVVLEKNSSSSSSTSWDDTPAATPTGSKPAGGERQDSIVWQHSQEMGIQLASLLIANGGFVVKGKPDAIRMQITTLVGELALSQFNDALDPRKSETFKLAQGIVEETGDDEPEDEPEATDDWNGGDDWSN
jgi:hypothetical protein